MEKIEVRKKRSTATTNQELRDEFLFEVLFRLVSERPLAFTVEVSEDEIRSYAQGRSPEVPLTRQRAQRILALVREELKKMLDPIALRIQARGGDTTPHR